MLLFRRNMTRHKKFPIAIMVTGKSLRLSSTERAVMNETVFCLTRVVATCLRIAWACHPTNIHVGLAATVFVYAGIVLLFLANLLFAQRMVRAQHPRFGWSKPFTIALPIIFVITVGTILCLVAAVITSSYTLNPYSRHATREIQKYGATMLAIVAFLPFVVAGTSSLVRTHPKIRMTKTTDKFGEGSMRAKVAIILISAVLLCLGASFRAGATLHKPVPIMISVNPPMPAQEPSYLSKACFYVFNFTIEIVVCFFWLAMRIDKRFYIPDGKKSLVIIPSKTSADYTQVQRALSHMLAGLSLPENLVMGTTMRRNGPAFKSQTASRSLPDPLHSGCLRPGRRLSTVGYHCPVAGHRELLSRPRWRIEFLGVASLRKMSERG